MKLTRNFWRICLIKHGKAKDVSSTRSLEYFDALKPWSSKHKGYPMACTLTSTALRGGLISMKSLSRRAHSGCCCRVSAQLSFL
uniref:Uncharacterized protein n=1 Tax=Arundo donax TaxID=35708 RepID=A0A0A9F248_ARUDO